MKKRALISKERYDSKRGGGTDKPQIIKGWIACFRYVSANQMNAYTPFKKVTFWSSKFASVMPVSISPAQTFTHDIETVSSSSIFQGRVDSIDTDADAGFRDIPQKEDTDKSVI